MPRIPQSKMAEADLPGRDAGMTKPRPVIVIDDRIEYAPDEPRVEVVVVTTTPDEPDGVYVDIPWHPSGACCTKLKEQSWACAHWVEHVDIGELNINKFGYCGPVALKKILAEVR